MMIVPVLSTLIVGALMFFVIGVPIVWATEALTTFLTNLQGSGNFYLARLSVVWLPLIWRPRQQSRLAIC